MFKLVNELLSPICWGCGDRLLVQEVLSCWCFGTVPLCVAVWTDIPCWPSSRCGYGEGWVLPVKHMALWRQVCFDWEEAGSAEISTGIRQKAKEAQFEEHVEQDSGDSLIHIHLLAIYTQFQCVWWLFSFFSIVFKFFVKKINSGLGNCWTTVKFVQFFIIQNAGDLISFFSGIRF